MKVLLLIAIITACGPLAVHKPAKSSPAPAAPALKVAYDERLAAYTSATSVRSGWPSTTDCDGVVWAGVAALGGAEVDVGLAEGAPGELHRRPAASPECYPVGSSSTISRDGAVLYAAASLKAADRGALERLLTYASAHGGFLGEPQDLGLTLLGPNLEGIIARAVDQLGGGPRPDAKLPEVEVPGVKDYQQHIEVEEILFASAAQGGATGWELGLLQALAQGAPQDALFQAALGVYTGDCAAAPKLLLDPATPAPSYVRGDQSALFADAWWLRAARLVLDHCEKG